MKRAHSIIIIGILLTILPRGIFLFSEETEHSLVPYKNSVAFFIPSENTQKLLSLNLFYGSHRNAAGPEGTILGYIPISVVSKIFKKNFNEYLGLSLRLNGMYHRSDFGFPGDSLSSEAHIKALYSIGKDNNFFYKTPLISGKGQHNLSFGYNGYLTTDTTSQIGGQLDYSFVNGDNAFIINYENDTMLFYSQDKYRTAGFKLTYLRDTGVGIAGVSTGFNLWAGERRINLLEIWNKGDIQIPSEIARGETVTLFNGKEYAVDVVFLSLIWNNLSLSFGYDSEIFKKIIHNSVHYVLDDGNLPILDRPDRFFIEFRIGLVDDLF